MTLDDRALPCVPVACQQVQQGRSLLQEDGARQLGRGQGMKLFTGVVVEDTALLGVQAPRCTFNRPRTGDLREEEGRPW